MHNKTGFLVAEKYLNRESCQVLSSRIQKYTIFIPVNSRYVENKSRFDVLFQSNFVQPWNILNDYTTVFKSIYIYIYDLCLFSPKYNSRRISSATFIIIENEPFQWVENFLEIIRESINFQEVASLLKHVFFSLFKDFQVTQCHWS